MCNAPYTHSLSHCVYLVGIRHYHAWHHSVTQQVIPEVTKSKSRNPVAADARLV